MGIGRERNQAVILSISERYVLQYRILHSLHFRFHLCADRLDEGAEEEETRRHDASGVRSGPLIKGRILAPERLQVPVTGAQRLCIRGFRFPVSKPICLYIKFSSTDS